MILERREKQMHKSSFAMEDVLESPHSSRSGAPSERQFKKRTRRRDFQRPHVSSMSFNNVYDCSRYINSTPKKQVYLYQWFLTRVGADHPENGMAKKGIQVALEGYTTSELLDHEKYRTAPIESRIEKCKLRTVDDVDILLMGAIDELCTYDNGFPIQVIHLFLTGFPFNWKYVISTCYCQPSLNMSVLPASKEKEYAWQENLNSDSSGIHMEDMGTDKSSLLDPEEKMSNVEENMSKVTSRRASSVRCSKKRKHGSQHILSSKRFRCGNLSIKSEPKVFSPFVGLLENQTNGHFASAEDRVHQRIVKNEAEKSPVVNVHLEKFEKNCTSGEQTQIIQIPVSEFLDTSCKTGKLISRDRSHTNRNGRNESSQASRSELCGEITEVALKTMSDTKHQAHHEETISTRALGEECTNLTQFPSNPEFRVIPNEIISSGIDGKGQREVDCLAAEAVDFDFICMKEDALSVSAGNKSSSLPENHLNNDVNKPVKQVNMSCTKIRGWSKNRTRCTDQAPELYKAFVHIQTNLNDNVMLKCNDIDATCGTNPYQVASEIENGMASEHWTEIGDDFIHTKEDVLSASVENKPSLLPENHLNNDVNKPLKQTNKSCTKMRGSPKKRTRHTDQSPELSKEFVCNQTTVNDIDANCGTNPYKVASEIEHGMASEHCIEIDDDFIHMKEDVLSASEENKLSSLPENYLNTDANKPVKQVHKSDRMRRGSSKKRTRCTDQPTELSEAFNDIDATCGTNPYQVASEIEHGMASKQCTEIGDNCREGIGDGEEGSVQTLKTITEINMLTQTRKRQVVKKLPPLLPRRVHTTPEEVSKAFGLKTSRFGRLLVPPLAHWCNQKIAYDLDGGIIAILDASSQRSEDDGSLNFKPPEEKDAIKIRKKLCKAANEVIWTPKSAKRACKD